MAGPDNTQSFKLDQTGFNATVLAKLESINEKCDRIERAQEGSHREIETIKVDLATRPCEEDWKEITKRLGDAEKKIYGFSLVILVLNAIAALLLKFVF